MGNVNVISIVIMGNVNVISIMIMVTNWCTV